MGDVFSCFKVAPNPNGPKKEIKQNSETALPEEVKFWESELGCKDDSLLLSFGFDEQNIKHVSFRQIEKDASRTFPESEKFMKEKNQIAFLNTLKKFAIYFPKTGYTQGLNFLSGFLIFSEVREQNAFMIMAKICTHRDFLTLGLYEDNFPLNRLYCKLFWKILDKKKPYLASSLKKEGVIDQLWIFQWFMTFYVISFPLYLISSFWTYILTRKEFSFVRLSLGIINQIEHLIMKSLQEGEIIQLFQQLKSKEFCQKHLRGEKIFKFADSIDEHFIASCVNSIQDDNFYVNYFKASEENRKDLYFSKIKKLTEERKAFLANPNLSSFSRNSNDISVLDFIVQKHYAKMYNSMYFEPDANIEKEKKQKNRQSLYSYRIWESDLRELNKSNLKSNLKS